MSQSHFIATLTLKQTPINDGNLVKINLSQENVSVIQSFQGSSITVTELS